MGFASNAEAAHEQTACHIYSAELLRQWGPPHRVWLPPRQGVETGARLLQTERRQRSDGLRAGGSVEVADRQWCDRECDSPCREPAVEGAEHLLAQDECGGRSAVTFVLQGGTLEPS